MHKTIISAALTLLAAAGALAVNPQYTKFLGLKYRDNCANFDAGQFQSITGCFDGKTRDTITLFPFDGFRDGEDGPFYYDQWILISKNGTVPSKTVQTYWPELVYEGDLDGNGRDELGVMLCGQMGCWYTYETYTYYGKKWRPFLSVTHYGCNDEDSRDILKRGAKKGQVRVREYNMDGDFTARTYTKSVTRFLK